MATVLKTNDRVVGRKGVYEIVELVHTGAFALCFLAKDAAGRVVFLKQSKKPSPTCAWYPGYRSHQLEVRDRIESSRAGQFVCGIVEFFEARPIRSNGRAYNHPAWFQVFDFLADGGNLRSWLDDARDRKPAWVERVQLGVVLAAAVRFLHDEKVVHADLKPENVFLVRRGGGKRADHTVRLVDIDFCVLTDRRAPWHGHQGYIGTPGYMSPEHQIAGAVPGTSSDVWTLALILHELLFGIVADPEDADARRHARGAIAVPGLPLAQASQLAGLLDRCLSRSPAARPTAEEIHEALRACVTATSASGKPSDAVADGLRRVAGLPSAAGAASGGAVPGPIGLAAGGVRRSFRVPTDVGRALLRAFHTDAGSFADTVQFRLVPSGERWWVAPNLDALNETLLNGAVLSAPAPVRGGDVISVGRAAKKISLLPVTIVFEETP